MEKYFLRVDEVMQILGVSKSYAYKVIIPNCSSKAIIRLQAESANNIF